MRRYASSHDGTAFVEYADIGAGYVKTVYSENEAYTLMEALAAWFRVRGRNVLIVERVEGESES